jgi:hypothetical protein
VVGNLDMKLIKEAGNYTIFVKGNRFEHNNLPENYPAISRKDFIQSPGEVKVFGFWRITGVSRSRM